MYAALRLRWWRSSHWHGGRCQRKQKKSIDQRAPQIGYEGIKSLRSLAMKNSLVTGGLLSLVESYNNKSYTVNIDTISRFIKSNKPPQNSFQSRSLRTFIGVETAAFTFRTK